MVSGFTFFVVVYMLYRGAILKAAADRATLFHRIGADGFIFSDGLVFQSYARSKVGCARMCSQLHNCRYFTFVQLLGPTESVSSRGSCRGHSICLDGNLSTGVAESGAVTYKTEEQEEAWLNKACTADCECPAANTVCGSGGQCTCAAGFFYSAAQDICDSWVGKVCIVDGDCPEAQAQCFKGQCLCRPGYYYTPSQDSCVIACAGPNLLSTFMEYTDSGIFGDNIFCEKPISFTDCQQKCANDISCRTFDYDYQGNERCGHAITPLDQPTDWWTLFSDVHFYQRHCA